MQINKDIKVAHPPLADTKVLIIDNFLKNPLDLTSRKFEHKEQLMPYPIGRREKENINEPILYDIIYSLRVLNTILIYYNLLIIDFTSTFKKYVFFNISMSLRTSYFLSSSNIWRF